MLAGVWQERIKRASVSFRLLAGVWQEHIKKASVSLGVLAGRTQAMLKTELKAANAPAGRSRAKSPECSLDFVLVAEIADFRGLVLVPLSGLERPPPNFSLTVLLGCFLVDTS